MFLIIKVFYDYDSKYTENLIPLLDQVNFNLSLNFKLTVFEDILSSRPNSSGLKILQKIAEIKKFNSDAITRPKKQSRAKVWNMRKSQSGNFTRRREQVARSCCQSYARA